LELSGGRRLPEKASPDAAGTAANHSGRGLKQWEAIKREEKKGEPTLSRQPPGSIARSDARAKAQSKVARVNFDWTKLGDVIVKVEGSSVNKGCDQEREQASIEDEIGDLLFAVVNLARKCKLDRRDALHAATNKFVGRFNLLGSELRSRGKSSRSSSPSG